jgi:two-component response regulator ARR-A family
MAPSPPLPAVSAPTKPKVVPAADAVEQERMHVLAVDDSNVDRAVIAKILRGSKYRGTVRWVGVG